MRDPAKSRVFKNAQNVLISRLDVQDIASIEHAVSEGVSRFGSIDVLLNIGLIIPRPPKRPRLTTLFVVRTKSE